MIFFFTIDVTLYFHSFSHHKPFNHVFMEGKTKISFSKLFFNLILIDEIKESCVHVQLYNEYSSDIKYDTNSNIYLA